MEECEICKRKGVSVVRQRFTCKYCYSLLSKDNARLFKKDKDIPNDISYLKSCKRYNCLNKFVSIIKYQLNEKNELEIVPEYCGEECRKEDEVIKLRKLQKLYK